MHKVWSSDVRLRKRFVDIFTILAIKASGGDCAIIVHDSTRLDNLHIRFYSHLVCVLGAMFADDE
jgi:hypothetical protein